MADKEAAKEIAATNIAAILVALGKTTADEITKAVEVYHHCLRELKKPPPTETRYPPETPEQERRIREGDLDVV